MSTTDTQPPEGPSPGQQLRRRAFLAGAGAGVAGTGLAVFTAAAGWPQTSGAQDDMDHDGGGGGTEMTDEEMLAHHEEGIKKFLANAEKPITKGQGAQPLESKVVDGVRIFELTVSEIEWETAPGEMQQAMAFNEQVPGPLIRCTEGETIRVVVKNKMKESTSIHWHGQMVPNKMDGVPFITQKPIRPGETFTYEFVAKPAGSHMYHSHQNSAEQVGKGLLGPLIVDPKDPSKDPKVDHDEVVILNDALGGFTINGKGFPATKAYKAKVGEKIRFRFMNEGMAIHPMHLHGFPMQVIARDGWPLPQPYYCDTVNIAPGERIDTIAEVVEAGTWVFHCHILTHA
ncbi:MAG: copper oxidase, partial [Acidimicrobiales bacterium]|nr:copper oxidase [Acidimicrobiales bacterium]